MVNKNNGSIPGRPGAVSTPVLQAGSSNSSNPSGSSAGAGGPTGTSGVSVVATPKPSKKGLRQQLAALASGFGTQIPAGSTIVVNGQSMTQQSIVSALQAGLVLFAAVDQAAQAAKSSRLPLQAAEPGLHQLVVALRAALVVFFGKGNPVLEAFGLSTAKPRQLTVEQKAARKAKAQATRDLRGTGGKRQKADVKFTGTAQVQTNLSGTQASPAGASSAGTSNTPSGRSGSGTTGGA